MCISIMCKVHLFLTLKCSLHAPSPIGPITRPCTGLNHVSTFKFTSSPRLLAARPYGYNFLFFLTFLHVVFVFRVGKKGRKKSSSAKNNIFSPYK